MAIVLEHLSIFRSQVNLFSLFRTAGTPSTGHHDQMVLQEVGDVEAVKVAVCNSQHPRKLFGIKSYTNCDAVIQKNISANSNQCINSS